MNTSLMFMPLMSLIAKFSAIVVPRPMAAVMSVYMLIGNLTKFLDVNNFFQ
ncbi:hypothetical protein LPB67_08745 [Undibacterium sp. Jales W-56]|uniref:hypothetical protein n=1 Tax=Undibacterium sp. Jales W-56 TaxID=2897325 RepID=UPI0021CE3A2E|nr:hypothetical protein [Undibacterium sp. Jales W-56]MCU6433864.1 hypothetical protein [Undibacterium sp. Jales W-56]